MIAEGFLDRFAPSKWHAARNVISTKGRNLPFSSASKHAASDISY
jgi:hypothetical protein